MPTDAFAHFVFVDFENVRHIDLDLVEGKPVYVTLLVGKTQTWLDLSLVRQIHRLAAQVELVEVGVSGRNALDFILACYLGKSLQQRPAAWFHIVAEDHDYDPMIAHLTDLGVKVARCDAFHLLPFLPRAKAAAPVKTPVAAKPAPVSKKPGVDKRTKEIARLKNPTTPNRPTTEKALRAHIKTALGKESTSAKIEEIFGKLRDDHAFTIETGGKVVWQ